MKNNFEIFIKDAVLNTPTHNSNQQQSWIAIDGRLRNQQQKKRFLFLGIAASLLITIGLGSMFLWYNHSTSNNYLELTSLEIYETEYYYASLIETKYQQIAETNNLNKEYFQLIH